LDRALDTDFSSQGRQDMKVVRHDHERMQQKPVWAR
jgi:hypothetical protein